MKKSFAGALFLGLILIGVIYMAANRIHVRGSLSIGKDTPTPTIALVRTVTTASASATLTPVATPSSKAVFAPVKKTTSTPVPSSATLK